MVFETMNGYGSAGDSGVALKDRQEPPSITKIKQMNGYDGGDNGGSDVGDDDGWMSNEDMMPTTMSGSRGDGGDNNCGGEEKLLRKGPWTAAEDVLLIKVVEELGPGDWVAIERYSGLARTSKSCRLRWTNHLRPNLKKGSFSLEEERLVVKMHYKYGNKWSRMARHLPGRTDNEIKNFWHSRVKKCKKQGLPIYPDWCQEEEEAWTDDEAEEYGVSDQPNHFSTSADDTNTNPPFAAMSEVQHASPAPYLHDQESLQYYSNQTAQSNSSLSSQDHMAYTQQLTFAYQTFENPTLEFNSSQPHIYKQSSTFHSTDNSRSASIPSSDMQYYSSQGQCFVYGPHYLSSSDQQSHMNHSLQAPALQIELPTQTHFQSTHNFHLSKPNPSTSNAFAPQLNHCSSANQLSSRYNLNFSVNNPDISTFKRLRAPPILSPPSGRFKRLHKPTNQLPPVPKPTQLSFTEQGQSVSASAASISPFHINTLSSAPHSSSELTSPTSSSRSSFKQTLSSNEPSSTSFQLKRNKLGSSASCPDMNKLLSCSQMNSSTTETPQSFLNLKAAAQTSSESHGQVNSSMTTSSGPSLKRTLSNSELPVSSLQSNSSPSQDYSSSFKSEPPSIQPPTIDLKPNFKKVKSKSYCDLLDASLMQEAQAESSLSDLHLVKGYLLSKQLKTKHLYGNMLARRMSQSISSSKGVMMGEIPWREGSLSGGSMESSDQRRTREVMMRKRPDTQYYTGNYSYRNFPINGSSNPVNFSSRKGSVPQDLMVTESLDNEKLLSENLLRKSSKRKAPVTNSLEKDLLTSTFSKRDQNLTPLTSSDVSGGSFHSAQLPTSDFLDSTSESSKKKCVRDGNSMGSSFAESSEAGCPLAIHGQDYGFDATGPLFSQSTITNPLKFDNSFGESTYFQSSVGESLGRKWPESLQTECIEDKALMNNYLDETLKSEGLLDSQDQLHGICDSSLLTCQYATPSLMKSSPPVAELSSSQPSKSESLDKCVKIDDLLCKNLEKSNTCDENLKKEPVVASTEPMPSHNGLDLVTSQSTAADKSNSRDQSSTSGSVKEQQKEPKEGKANAMAEELSSLLVNFPTTALEFPNMDFSDDQLNDYPGFDMSFDLLSPTFLFA